MLTPKQKIYLQNPKVQMLIKAFDAEPVQSKEFELNQKIEARVEAIIEQIKITTPTPRKISFPPKPRKPWDTPDLSHLKPGECPF